MAADGPASHIDVCIASYRRPAQLRLLLEALARQETAGRFTFSIRVADNDAQRSAEAVVRECAAAGLPVAYDVEPVQNIALARNRSLAGGAGQWVATIDDDVVPSAQWLASLLDAAARFEADAVCGPAVPQFLPGTPAWVRDFHRLYDPPSGSESGYVPATCNFFFRRSLIEGDPAPFDARFGLSGGEDTDFYNRLRARGCRIVWCREAAVASPVCRERATLRWLLQRKYRYGITTRDVHGTPLTPRIAAYLLWCMTKEAAAAVAALAASLVSRASRERAQIHLVRVLTHGAFLAGRLARTMNLRYAEYRA